MSKLIDLTGQKFGRLTVIERALNQNDNRVRWKCKCDCGNVVNIRGDQLRSGGTKSCGCYQKDLAKERIKNIHPQAKDLTGQKFGRWVVLNRSYQFNYKEPYWTCQCECGTIRDVKGGLLTSGGSKSCGCYMKDVNKNMGLDLTGQRFGRLTVLKRDFSKKLKDRYWICQCDCGNQTSVSTKGLRNKNSQSCGCYMKEKSAELMRSLGKKNKINLINQVFGDITVLEEIGRSNNNEVIWLCECSCGNTLYTTTNNLRRGYSQNCGCKNGSLGEQLISKILLDNHILFETEKKFNNCRFSDSKYLARFDFYLPDYNTLIEYDGVQHFLIGTGPFDNPEKFKITQEHDNFKNKWAKENGYILIRIPYTQYDNLTIDDLLPNTSTFIVK